MWGLARNIVNRCAVAAVALALSGAMELVEPPAGSPGHRCHCPVREGRHDCDCPLCLAEAAKLGTSAADDPSLPPCHRALAARARAEADQSDKRRATTAPCLTNPCGTSERRFRPPPGGDRFVVPVTCQGAAVAFSAEVAVRPAWVLSVQREPETPPPRAA